MEQRALAGTFLAKWLGGRVPPAPEVEKARAELERLASERPTLRQPARWLREGLLAIDIPSSAPFLAISPEAAREKLAAGIPLLRGEKIELDCKAIEQRWQRACAALGPDDARAGPLASALEQDQLSPQQIVGAILGGRPEWIYQRAIALGLDASLTATLTRLTLFPTFVAINERWAQLYANSSWERGYCPVCGSWPILAELRGLDQLRYLRCGLCAAGWKVPRLSCTFCDSRDHQQLKSFHREGEDNQWRVSCCDACRRYVKMVITLSELSPIQLWVADVSTLPLDFAAAERGYCQ